MEDDYSTWKEDDFKNDSSLLVHFTAAITALSVAQNPIKRLSVGLWKLEGGRCSWEELNGVPVPDLQTLFVDSPLCRGLRFAFRDLASLRMALEYRRHDLYRDTGSNRRTMHWLRDFLSLAPNLKNIELWFDGMTTDLERIFTHRAFAAVARHIRLAHLTSLELHHAVLTGKLLRRFFNKHTETLARVYLQRIRLSPPTAQPSVTWSYVLEALCKSSLYFVKLECLYEEGGELVMCDIDDVTDCDICPDHQLSPARLTQRSVSILPIPLRKACFQSGYTTATWRTVRPKETMEVMTQLAGRPMEVFRRTMVQAPGSRHQGEYSDGNDGDISFLATTSSGSVTELRRRSGREH